MLKNMRGFNHYIKNKLIVGMQLDTVINRLTKNNGDANLPMFKYDSDFDDDINDSIFNSSLEELKVMRKQVSEFTRGMDIIFDIADFINENDIKEVLLGDSVLRLRACDDVCTYYDWLVLKGFVSEWKERLIGG